jgi:pimeloyl-ACP methyl ester carboxylesterase
MKHVHVNGVGLAVEEWPGRGPAIVCVHGLSANHLSWDAWARFLAPRHRVIAYDLRGRGDSDKPDTGYNLAQHGDDLAALLDHLGLPRAIVMGHSLGAAIVARFAADRPERVAKLVLVDGGMDMRPEVVDAVAPAVNRLGVEFESMEMFLGLVRMLPMFPRWDESLEKYFRYDVETLPSGAVRSKAPKAAIVEELTNLRRERLSAYPLRIACPTLILRAPDGIFTETDVIMSQAEGEALARAIPKAELVVLPGTNHYSMMLGDNPTLEAALFRFLDA